MTRIDEHACIAVNRRGTMFLVFANEYKIKLMSDEGAKELFDRDKEGAPKEDVIKSQPWFSTTEDGYIAMLISDIDKYVKMKKE